eukprot:scaffold294478_cov35-Tisochrysis_lutea.AAC.4
MAVLELDEWMSSYATKTLVIAPVPCAVRVSSTPLRHSRRCAPAPRPRRQPRPRGLRLSP